MNWDDLEDEDPSGTFPSPVSHAQTIPRIPENTRLLVVDFFDLSRIDMNLSGAALRVVPLSRAEALGLVAEHKPAIDATHERSLATLERELGLDALSRPKVGPRTALLVMSALRWNDVRWHLVLYESDGEGLLT